MQKWEHQVLRSNLKGDKELQELINTEGYAGWELVSVLEEGQNPQITGFFSNVNSTTIILRILP